MKSIARACLLLALIAAHVCCGEALYGAKLYGGGTTTITPLMHAWLRAYSFVRDDIGLNYTETGSDQAIADYDKGTLDFIVHSKAISPELSPLFNDISQFPLVGEAQVMTYNIPELLPTDPNLIFDRTTLALIQMGNITHWNDERILALNPELRAKLPALPIVVAYTDSNSTATSSELWKQALESFSSEFRDMFKAANRTFALMPPALSGSGLPAPADRKSRIEWIKTHTYGLMMLGVGSARNQGIQWANMINKAGNLVKPEAAAVQSAMVDFSSRYRRNNFGIDIFDGNGNRTWPLSFVTFFSIQRNLSVFDCTSIQELLYFVSWIYTNDATSQCAFERGYAPLAQFLRVRLIDWLSTVQCNGQRALASQYLIGTGAPLSLHTAWSVAYSSGEVKAKYFVANPVEARENMADFIASNNGAGLNMTSLVPDAAYMPATAVAIAPGYNLPQLGDDGPSLAGILTNNITMWNDQRIQDLNPPSVANALPAQPITVISVVRDASSPPFGANLIVSDVLRNTLPAFEGFDDSRLPADSGSRWIAVPGSSTALSLLMTTPYSFTILPSYELLSTRGLGAASIRKLSGHVVHPSAESVRSTIHDQIRTKDGFALSYDNLIHYQASEQSWPFTAFSSFIYRSSSMQDCAKAKALAEYLYWTQTDPIARQISERQDYVPLTTVPELSRLFYDLLKNFTCEGRPVSAYYNCIDDGMLCSGIGMCSNNSCVCPTGRCGVYCDKACAAKSKDNVPVVLGAVIPTSIVLLALIITVTAVVMVLRRRSMDRDWEISYDELDVREQLGVGGYGEVHKAIWKGTEVAVKVMVAGRINKEMEKSFKQEVRLMTTLRHPHVVLFMAASTKPPKMCIVMEYMSLGSLYDLLHNELIGEIPFELKAKMAYQSAKGMHFLHSSGIVHRDLKSLNLLLDAKWNVKVSDFGLTKFKEDVEKHRPDRNGSIAGSIHWTAPELISQTPCVDLMLADVYSFGIILWELLTRLQPYCGMSHAAVAVAVIRDGIRPRMPDNIEELCTLEYAELIAACWHQNPAVRPAFLDIMCSLSAMFESESSSSGRSNAPSDLSSCAAQPPSTIIVGDEGDEEDGDEDEDSDDSTNEADDGSCAQEEDEEEASDSSDRKTTMSAAKAWVATEQLRLMTEGYGAEGQREAKKGRRKKTKKAKKSKKAMKARKEARTSPPEGSEVTIVFADITRAASLWDFDPESMRDATILYNTTLRKLLHKHYGYEALARCHDDNNTGEGSFCMAFVETTDALEWCMAVQRKLLRLPWPEGLLVHPGAAEEEQEGELLFRGLRVRMGVHVGSPRVTIDPLSLRGSYAGPVVDSAARITAVAHGGQILMSKAALRQVQDSSLAGERDRIVSLGRFTIPGLPDGSGQKLYELTVRGLEERLFGGVCQGCIPSRYQTKTEDEDARGRRQLAYKHITTEEDCFLNSANLCRWVIEADDLQLEEQLGMGSYGMVYRARWKGVNVAVKRFVRQKLDERLMLEFRAEVALLSELHHPNIVLFIGACVKKPNLCLVTEFVKQGSLKDILLNPTIKLPLEHKLKLLHSAALGIHYLHSLHPAIIHRDLKSSNLLVDENWNVKVSDFGFARIKDENQTMTPQTGSPCWTSPEVLLGKRYNEKADIYSYGVVMWEVVVRRQPYCGRHFLSVSLDVIAGKRPPLPSDCPPGLRDLIQRCWQSDAAARPGMDEVLAALEAMLLLAQHRDSATRTSL